MIKNTTKSVATKSSKGGFVRLQDPQVRDAETIAWLKKEVAIPDWNQNICERPSVRAMLKAWMPVGSTLPLTTEAEVAAEAAQFVGYNCCASCDSWDKAETTAYWAAKKAWAGLNNQQREEGWALLNGYYK